MTNKRIILSGAVVVVMVLLLSSVYWCLCSNKIESGCGYVIVDGACLRISNEEFMVTNFLSFCVKPTKKTSEWINVYGRDCVIWINEHRLEVSETSLRHFWDGREESVEMGMKDGAPVLLRFFKNEVVISGTGSSMKERIRIENMQGLYDVRIQVGKVCRIVVKANWYEYTG